MTSLLIALLVFLAVGIAATAWLRRGAARAPGNARGPAELATENADPTAALCPLLER